MSNERRCIRITGTRTGQLRARVETTKRVHVGLGYYQNDNQRLEITLGGKRWDHLEDELRTAILKRARTYVANLEVLVRNIPNNQGCALNRIAHQKAGG